MASVRAYTVLFVLGVLAVSCCSRAAHADTPGAFPHLEPWPKGVALGGISSGLGEGVEAVLLNPTGMLKNPAGGAAVSHASLFSGGLVRHQAAAICWTRYQEEFKYDDGQVRGIRGAVSSALGLGVTNLSGDLPGDDSYGELQISLAYSRSVLSGIRTGFRLRVVTARSSVDGTDGGGYAFDFGMEGTLWGMRMGGVARSLFSEVRWDRSVDGPIPLGFDLGLERRIRNDLIMMAGTSLRDNGAPRRLSVAAVWEIPRYPIVLRAAPAWRDTGYEQITEISAGAGIKVRSFWADYGMRTGPPGLGEIHRFGVRVALQ